MTETFHNPIIEEGADPFVTAWQGNYYYVYSVGDARIEVSRADNIHHLTRAGKCVFRPEPDMPYSKQLWAPEIHEIDGDWYLYVAADDGDPVNHRMYVLRSRDKTPDGEYEMIGVPSRTVSRSTARCCITTASSISSGLAGTRVHRSGFRTIRASSSPR